MLVLDCVCELAVTLRSALKLFRAKGLFRDAAFLAFFFLLSAIPLLSLVLWVIGRLAEPLLGNPAELERIRNLLLRAGGEVFPFLAADLEGLLREVVSVPRSAGFLWLMTMLISVWVFLRALSHSTTWVLDVESLKLLKGIRNLVFLLLASVGAALLLFLFVARLLPLFGEGNVSPFVAAMRGIGGLLIRAVIVVSGFYLTVHIASGKTVKTVALLAGGLLFHLSWEGASLVFAIYLNRVPTLSMLYGSLTTAAIVMWWAYYTAVMYLFALCVSKELGGVQCHHADAVSAPAAQP